jgi:drug/metabolite transporter superfamily protein YnfA
MSFIVLTLGCSICRKCLWVKSLHHMCRRISLVRCGTCVSLVLHGVVAMGSYGLVVAVNGDVEKRRMLCWWGGVFHCIPKVERWLSIVFLMARERYRCSLYSSWDALVVLVLDGVVLFGWRQYAHIHNLCLAWNVLCKAWGWLVLAETCSLMYINIF